MTNQCGDVSMQHCVTVLFLKPLLSLSRQVKNRVGRWIDAVPIEDCVVVNIGDLMQRWTTDRLVSNVRCGYNFLFYYPLVCGHASMDC
jgi:hypothetical protein